MSGRWPLHPPPFPGESLSSWLMRLAQQFMVAPEELLRHEFGIPATRTIGHWLDFDPPGEVIAGLAEKTGQEPAVIRGLTARGYVPGFYASLEAAIHGVNHYIGDLAFLLPRYWRLARPARVLPWHSRFRFRAFRGCRACLQEFGEARLLLRWRFSWAMCCPVHRRWLEPYRLAFSTWGTSEAVWSDPVADERPVPSELVAMDAITLQAVTDGGCDTPWGRAEGGDWLRLLRTLLEDLSTAAMNVGDHRHRIGAIWSQAGLPYRNGMRWWRPYETMAQAEQEAFMLAAARALSE